MSWLAGMARRVGFQQTPPPIPEEVAKADGPDDRGIATVRQLRPQSVDCMLDIGGEYADGIERRPIAAALRNRGTRSPAAPAISHRPVRKMTVSGSGTQAGVMTRKGLGRTICRMPAGHKTRTIPNGTAAAIHQPCHQCLPSFAIRRSTSRFMPIRLAFRPATVSIAAIAVAGHEVRLVSEIVDDDQACAANISGKMPGVDLRCHDLVRVTCYDHRRCFDFAVVCRRGFGRELKAATSLALCRNATGRSACLALVCSR